LAELNIKPKEQKTINVDLTKPLEEPSIKKKEAV
jgi:hypothetical protein